MNASEKLGVLEMNLGSFHDPVVTEHLRAALSQIRRAIEAAEDMSDFLEHDKETHEPPRSLLDKGYVALVSSVYYEREEELGEALLTALRALNEALE